MPKSLLPPNASLLERRLSEVAADLERASTPLHTLWDPWQCPISMLPWLAWALGVTEWSIIWPEQRQRQVVAAALAVRQKAGTRGAVRTAVEALDIENIGYSEWYEYGGEPHHYRISAELRDRGMSEDEYQQLMRVLRINGRLSSWLDSAGFALIGRGSPRTACTPMAGLTTTILPLRRSLRSTAGTARTSIGTVAAASITVLPPTAFELKGGAPKYSALTIRVVVLATVYPAEI